VDQDEIDKLTRIKTNKLIFIDSKGGFLSGSTRGASPPVQREVQGEKSTYFHLKKKVLVGTEEGSTIRENKRIAPTILLEEENQNRTFKIDQSMGTMGSKGPNPPRRRGGVKEIGDVDTLRTTNITECLRRIARALTVLSAGNCLPSRVA